MKIAHLILCHNDLPHIVRLTKRLSAFSDVFIHVDKKWKDGIKLEEILKDIKNCYFVKKRERCRWGSYKAVEAEIALMRLALSIDKYDRIVFLQGADYPIKSNTEVLSFFEKHRETEFIRGCCCTTSKDPYFYMRCRGIFFYHWIKAINIPFVKIEKALRLKFRSGYIKCDNVSYKVYWGSALWAFTGACAEYILQFYDSHKKFNRWFKYSFPSDELYFVTVVMNSKFAEKTTEHGPEEEHKELDFWKNLHLLHYNENGTYIFRVSDFEEIKNSEKLYCRKVTTFDSTLLMDNLEKQL